jgi:hypothetical protein
MGCFWTTPGPTSETIRLLLIGLLKLALLTDLAYKSGVRYERLPYAARYLVALTSWALLFAAAAVVKFGLVYFLPFLWIGSGLFKRDQRGAQLGANLVDFYLYAWPPFPRAKWGRLLGRARRRSADQPPQPRLIEKVGYRLV